MQRLVWWLRWHRRVGALVAVFAIGLAISGILINHSHDLGWQKQPVYSTLIARLYGIPFDTVANGFPVQERWVSRLGQQLMLDKSVIAACPDVLAGAAVLEETVAALCGDSLLLFSMQGEMIETIRVLPAPAFALGITQQQAQAQQRAQWVVQGANAIFHLDENSGEWIAATGPVAVRWAESALLPTSLRTALEAINPVPGLTREQVLLDLHSGRLFGSAGVWAVDVVAILLCLLAFSGTFAWAARIIRRWQRKY